MRMIHERFMIYLVIAAISLFGCTKERKAPDSGPSPGVVQQTSTDTAKLRIMPESPTVLTDLEAVYSGSGKTVCQWQRNSKIITGATSARLPKDQFVKGDKISVTVTTDEAAGTALVSIFNAPPTVVSVPVSPTYLRPGMDVTVAPVSYDPDGDQVQFRYQWSVNGQVLPEDSPVLRGNKFKRGDTVSLMVTPYDNDGEGQPFIARNIGVANSAPRIVSEPPGEFRGDVYTYQVVAEDPDGDPVEFSLVSAPAGMTIDAKTGVVAWQIDEKSRGVHIVEISAQDQGGLKGTQKYSLTITLPEEGGK